MIPLNETFPIPAPIERVWPLLCDPAMVASCIPGAALSAASGDDCYRGNITFKFGPTVAIFRGEAILSYDNDARCCTIDAIGTDQRGASHAKAKFLLTTSGTTTTQVTMDGSIDVNGPLEMFAKAGGVHVARALMAEFAGNIARIVGERHQAITDSTSSRSGDTGESIKIPKATQEIAKPQSIAGGQLLWQSCLGWLRSLFSR